MIFDPFIVQTTDLMATMIICGVIAFFVAIGLARRAIREIRRARTERITREGREALGLIVRGLITCQAKRHDQ